MKTVRMSAEVFRKRAVEDDGCMISAIGLQPLFSKRQESTHHVDEAAREPVRHKNEKCSHRIDWR
jgi:hypothetical protein